MTAALLSIGDELLIGQVVNTNASWLGERLTDTGVDVVAVSTVGDVRERIVSEIRRLAALSDLVIVSGGLGPTEDDLTREAICNLLGCEMRIDDEQLALIEQRFAERGIELNERSRQQARVPSAAQVLTNSYGSAPGLDFTVDRARIVVVPGVPSELKGIITDHLLPDLVGATGSIDRTTFLVFGPTESALADMLVDLVALAGDGVTLAYLPSLGGIRVRALRTRDDDAVVMRYRLLVDGIRERVAGWLVSDRGESLAEATGVVLRERGLTLATAESCTGGMIGELVTEVSGSSAYYLGGIVSYANETKIELLGVPASKIAEHGAVSREVVEAMAQGVRRRLGASIGVAVTGVAGPTGGTPEKPVGTVWIAVASDRSVSARRFSLGSERSIVRMRAANLALDSVRREALSLQRPVA